MYFLISLLGLALISGIPIAIVMTFIASIICWRDNCQSSAPKIKYKTFKTFYNINPERWNLSDNHVECKVNDETNGRCIFSYGNLYKSFRFSYFDYLKYFFWNKYNERCELKIEQAESTAAMLAAVQKDINSLEERAKHEKNAAIDDLQKILNNLRGDK